MKQVSFDWTDYCAVDVELTDEQYEELKTGKIWVHSYGDVFILWRKNDETGENEEVKTITNKDGFCSENGDCYSWECEDEYGEV